MEKWSGALKGPQASDRSVPEVGLGLIRARIPFGGMKTNAAVEGLRHRFGVGLPLRVIEVIGLLPSSPEIVKFAVYHRMTAAHALILDRPLIVRRTIGLTAAAEKATSIPN